MVHVQLLQTLAVLLIAQDTNIYKGSSDTMAEMPGHGKAIDGALTADGETYVIGIYKTQHYHDGNTWIDMHTGEFGYRLAVDKCGTMWMIDVNNRILKWTGYSWYQVTENGRGYDISIDGKNRPWVIDLSNHVQFFDNVRWQIYPGNASGKKIAVARDGTPYIIGMDDNVYKGTGTSWEQVAGGKGIDVSIGPSGLLWTLDMEGRASYLTNGKWYHHPSTVQAVAISST